ncbi:MAG: sulfonate transporter substrate-binding protein [Acidimicrobiales bacterium]|nr:sulfonate transporter substrate-binding protein [Acidimicrobiales bacterium]
MRVSLLRRLAVVAVGLGLLAAACGSGGSSSAGSKSTTTAGHVDLRLGYFPNLTHATALVGVANGIFAKDLGPNVTLKTTTFNAGPAAVEALFGGQLDITYVGPNPAINAFQKSNGTAVRLIAGATSGGAALVVKPTINSAADLKGKKLATPQLGNTQDVALRSWLKSQGLKTTPEGGGDVQILPQDNAQTLDTFKSGQIDGAWVPEPWATRLVLDGKGKVLVDEKSLWPDGKFLTTTIIVSTGFLKDHPDVVEKFLKGHVEATDYVNQHPTEAQATANTAIGQLTGKPLAAATVATAWKNLTFTWDPLASTLRKEASDAEAAGLLKAVNLNGLVDVKPLNNVLTAAGKPKVTG